MRITRPSLNKRRSKRLRKKLHIAEFKEEGFEVSFLFGAGLSNEEELDTLTRFIVQAIESRGLAFGGGEGGFVTRASGGSTTNEDRDAVEAWLRNCPNIKLVSVSENTDAWYCCAPSDA
jgi:uncharacterized protein